jgi:hypothetical protein
MGIEALHIVIATGIALVWLGILFGWLCTWEHDKPDGSHAARFADRRSDRNQDKFAA